MWGANGDTKSTFGKGGAKPLPPPLLRKVQRTSAKLKPLRSKNYNEVRTIVLKCFKIYIIHNAISGLVIFNLRCICNIICLTYLS